MSIRRGRISDERKFGLCRRVGSWCYARQKSFGTARYNVPLPLYSSCHFVKRRLPLFELGSHQELSNTRDWAKRRCFRECCGRVGRATRRRQLNVIVGDPPTPTVSRRCNAIISLDRVVRTLMSLGTAVAHVSAFLVATHLERVHLCHCCSPHCYRFSPHRSRFQNILFDVFFPSLGA